MFVANFSNVLGIGLFAILSLLNLRVPQIHIVLNVYIHRLVGLSNSFGGSLLAVKAKSAGCE